MRWYREGDRWSLVTRTLVILVVLGVLGFHQLWTWFFRYAPWPLRGLVNLVIMGWLFWQGINLIIVSVRLLWRLRVRNRPAEGFRTGNDGSSL